MYNLDQPSEQAYQARLADFDAWLNSFAILPKYADKIEAIPNAAILLNQYYWNVVQAYVRPLLSSQENVHEETTHHLINRFKIISITELTVMAVLPFNLKKGTEFLEEEVNARFAWYCAVAILTGWDKIDMSVLNQIIGYRETLNPGAPEEKKAELSFRAEHIQFLTTLDTKVQLPVLSNAQTWRMLYFCILALSNKLT